MKIFMHQKLIPLLLAAALALCVLPASAAEGGDGSYGEAASELVKYRITAYGGLRLDEPLIVIECLESLCRYGHFYPDEDFLSDDWLKVHKTDIDRDWSEFEEKTLYEEKYPDLTEKEKAIIGMLSDMPSLFVLGEHTELDYETRENYTVPSEWKDIDIRGLCTESSALLYMVRAVTDTYGCVREYSDYDYTVDERYAEAYDKGIIDSADSANADNVITRGRFFEMFYRMLNAEYSSGAGGIARVKNIDYLKRAYDNKNGATPEPHNVKTDNAVNFLPKADDALENEAVVESYVSPYDRWAARGAFEGFPETPSGDSVMNRGEFAVVLSNVMGFSHTFSDGIYDMPSDWRRGALQMLTYYDIMTGYRGYIEPDREVAPDEAYAMLARAFYVEETDETDPAIEASNISDWAKPIVSAMYALGYLSDAELLKTSFTYNDMFEIMDRLAPYYYGKELRYGTDEVRYYNGNVIINSSLLFENAVINGDMYLSDLSGSEYIKLKNVTVNGALYLDDMSEVKPYLMGCSARFVFEKGFNGAEFGSGQLYLENLDGSEFKVAAGRDPIVHEDMSITWDYPENMLGADGLEIVSLDENGEKIGSTTLSNVKNELDTRTVMSVLDYLAPKKAAKFLINYKPLRGNADSMEVDV